MDTKPIIKSMDEDPPVELLEEQADSTSLYDAVNPLSTITSTVQDTLPNVQLPTISQFTDLFSPEQPEQLEQLEQPEQPEDQELDLLDYMATPGKDTPEEGTPEKDTPEEGTPEKDTAKKEQTEAMSDDILQISSFQEGSSLILLSKNIANKYHNTSVDFLYEEQGVLYLLHEDDLLELTIKDNKIVKNDNQIYKIQKKKDIEYSHDNAFIVNELDLTIIESGIEIQERLLSEWEREWTENEHISSIITNVEKIYKHKHYYELDAISKNLLELVHDTKLYSTILLPDEHFNEDDNKTMIQNIYSNNYSNTFIKPIVMDKKKFVTNKMDTVSDDIYIESIKDDIKILASLQYRNFHPQADHYRSSVDSYEKELMIGNKDTQELNDDGHLDGNVDGETLEYINPVKTYINEYNDRYSFEYHTLETGLEYNTKVYRHHFPRYSIVTGDSDVLQLNFKDIETRYADGHYYRYYDTLDKRRITDTYGKLKATQICHGIKAETLFSDSIDERGRANIKKHKDSFFNKSISKLPSKNIYIEGEKILICGFVLHNATMYTPTFVTPNEYISDTGLLKINYNSGDYGYTLMDYIDQHTKNVQEPYMKVYDINHNKSIYKNSFVDVPALFNINKFIYFNTHKKLTLKKMIIDDEEYSLSINKQGRLDIHNITTQLQEESKDINDPSIPTKIIDTLVTYKLIKKSAGIFKPVFKNIQQAHHLETIKNIVPSVTDILTYEYHNSEFLYSTTIKNINKTLSKYDLTYNTLPKKHRSSIKRTISDNIKQYKQDSIQRMKQLKKYKQNKFMIEKIYNEIDIDISKLISHNQYHTRFTKLNIKRESYTGRKPELEKADKTPNEKASEYQERIDLQQRNYTLALQRWNVANEKYNKSYEHQQSLDTLFDSIKSRIKAKCNLYILNEQFVSMDQLEMFLDYISDHTYDRTKNNDRSYLISEIVDILYSRFDTIYYKNLFFDDISTTSYENFCKIQKSGSTTLYCSEQSLEFLKEFYTYNDLHIYDSYQQNTSTNLSKNNLQLIDMITKCKKNKNYELLLDIYKNIQIEKELVNIEKSYNRIMPSSDSSSSVEEILEQHKREFMMIRNSFNNEINKTIYYDACYGFKIVKIYKNKYDLLSDNMVETTYYDDVFDTTENDIDIIHEYQSKNMIELDDIDRPDTVQGLYNHFKNYYVFSPEYEIKNIVHNAIVNIKKMDIMPKKNSSGKIIINKMNEHKNAILWMGIYFSLHTDGTMRSNDEVHEFNINDISLGTTTIIVNEDTVQIDTYKLFTYLDRLNIIHIQKKNVQRPIVNGEFAILKHGDQRNIYKRINNKWIVLNEEKIAKDGTCLLDKYKFKKILSLEFDDLLLLNENMINEIEANPNIDLDEGVTSSLQQMKDSMEGSLEGSEQTSSVEVFGDVPIQKVLASVPETEPDAEPDAAVSPETDSVASSELDTGQAAATSPEQSADVSLGGSPENVSDDQPENTGSLSGGDYFKDDLTNFFGISENIVNNMEGGADSAAATAEDTPGADEQVAIDETFNGFNSCINTNFLPINVQKIFKYPSETDDYDIDYLNITVPKKIIKFIFNINKKFNLITDMDHVIIDKQSLISELNKQNIYIHNRLRILKKNFEEQQIYDDRILAMKTIKKKNKKTRVPKYIQQQFYAIFLIQDMDICLTTLKEFIEKYGIYNKPEDDDDDTLVTPIRQEGIACLDPERDPSTANFIYWDPYFFAGVNQVMCCKHYIDLTNIAWLDNQSRNTMIEDIAVKYGQKDHTEGGHIICKHCGENINHIKYSDQEGFGAEDKPIVFREKIKEDEYDDLLLTSDYTSQFFSKKILFRFIKAFNISLTKEDTAFIELNSFKMYKLYEKNQKEIYMKFSNEFIQGKKILHTNALEKCKIFYTTLIQKNPHISEFFNIIDKKKQKKQKKTYLKNFMVKYFKKIKKDNMVESREGSQFLKFSDAILKQTEKYNTSLQVYTTMIYFIFIMLYSTNHYKIISSGDSRYTQQRFVIYDSEELLKNKCIELASQEKRTAGKKTFWNKFIFNEDLFESIYKTISKYPDIQGLKQAKLEYDLLLEKKNETIQKTLEWNTFRPNLIPDYNYNTRTSIDELTSLITELKSVSNTTKKYKLLSHISEETRKLSLEHISKINNFIISNKQIKHLNFVSYQSSCCNFNIHETYKDTLSSDLQERLNDISVLYNNLQYSDSDYYLLNDFKGINDNEKSRYLLEYLNMKTKLHNEYETRKQSDTYHITDKDVEYKEYLENKIYKINYYVVTEEIFTDDTVGYKRMFVTIMDPDYEMLSTLDVTDDLAQELENKLNEKYKDIYTSFNITPDQLNDEAYQSFIKNKVKIIIEHDGETQKDLITNTYIYEITATIKAYIEQYTIDELKQLVERLEHYLEKNIKTILTINTNESQQDKTYTMSRYKKNYVYNQLSSIKTITNIFEKIDHQNELFTNDTLFNHIRALYNSSGEDGDDDEDEGDEETDILLQYTNNIDEISSKIIDIYDDLALIHINVPNSIKNFKKIYGDISNLIDILGFNNELEKEKYGMIENDLIVQGYKKNSVKYKNELMYRKRTITTNLESDRIGMYKESIKYILNVYNKINYFKQTNFVLKEADISQEDILIRTMVSEQSDLNIQSTFIQKNIHRIYKLLDILTSKRDIYDVHNTMEIKSLYNVEIVVILIKYIFVKVLYSFMLIGNDLSGVQRTSCDTLKKLIVSNISNIHIQLKNTDEMIQDEIIAYQKIQNDARKTKFERMVNYDRENASIYLISRTINMGDIFTKRNEQNEALYTVNDAGGMAAFVTQALDDGEQAVATADDMENYEQNQADMEAAEEFGMGNVMDEDEE